MNRRSSQQFSQDLRNSAVALTGYVTDNVQLAGGERATLIVKRVFKQHNERQRAELRLIDGEWRIVGLFQGETFEPAIVLELTWLPNTRINLRSLVRQETSSEIPSEFTLSEHRFPPAIRDVSLCSISRTRGGLTRVKIALWI